ncbi:hypothetical protein EK21DRAFT_118441 [Setomelanomma holmii]|uniref:Uncharacterized protein n=1 Tax=Setomelanomma holmii TaxID=210430 RepID=A0A9P4GY13_9PLEO|nr:hypothetical protein EK21DRAFT_118441 [Setomelanomma holmii]
MSSLRDLPNAPMHVRIQPTVDSPSAHEGLDAMVTLHSTLFSRRARQAGTQSMGEGILIGTDANGNNIQAALFNGPVDQYECDHPNRAYVILATTVMEGHRTVPHASAVVLTPLKSIDEVVQWHSGIQGDNVAERYAFVYDVLVAEAKSHTS